jgi:hypothetical protein
MTQNVRDANRPLFADMDDDDEPRPADRVNRDTRGDDTIATGMSGIATPLGGPSSTVGRPEDEPAGSGGESTPTDPRGY